MTEQNKVSIAVDVSKLKVLAAHARKIDNRDDFIDLAIEWAEQATAHVYQLQGELKELRTSPWQPIETAPKDGVEIIGKCANGDVHIAYGHHYANGSKFEWAQFDGENAYKLVEWMPIPPLPEEE